MLLFRKENIEKDNFNINYNIIKIYSNISNNSVIFLCKNSVTTSFLIIKKIMLDPSLNKDLLGSAGSRRRGMLLAMSSLRGYHGTDRASINF